ncbi:MAG: hypothetical protein LAP40_28210 [Acidobacteriia bacterium]|nr:hypothetical protein [Terriglobia bacterium]
MIHLKISAAALLASSFLCLAFAEDRPGLRSEAIAAGSATEKSADLYDLAIAATRSVNPGLGATVSVEVFQNVVIAAGKTVSLDSALDYSTSNTVAVTVQCIVCTSATTALGASGLILQARWMAPNTQFYVATENKAASAFPYWDAGGAIFSVYGPQFRLTLQNSGSQPIAIQQITLLRRS